MLFLGYLCELSQETHPKTAGCIPGSLVMLLLGHCCLYRVSRMALGSDAPILIVAVVTDTGCLPQCSLLDGWGSTLPTMLAVTVILLLQCGEAPAVSVSS